MKSFAPPPKENDKRTPGQKRRQERNKLKRTAERKSPAAYVGRNPLGEDTL